MKVKVYTNTDVHLMFVDPCIIVQFIQKNPTKFNSGLVFARRWQRPATTSL